MSHCKLFGKRAGAFKQHLEGDWTNHLSVTVDHRLTSATQINSRRALPAVPVVKSNSYRRWSGEDRKYLSVLFFDLL